jgi:hypothetical protein
MRISFSVGEVWGSNIRQLPDPGLPDLVVEGHRGIGQVPGLPDLVITP